MSEIPTRHFLMERLNDLIRNEKCIIFCKTKCGFCDLADEFFTSKALHCKKVLLDDNPWASAPLQEKTQLTTVPNIFINGVPVGGYQQLSEYWAKCQRINKAEEQADVVCMFLLKRQGV